jgi:hypothetical protein
MIESFAKYRRDPLSIRVVGSGEYVSNFLCNLEREFQEAEDERSESIR